LPREAVRLLKVTWKEFPFIYDPEEASKAGATLVNENLKSNVTSAPTYKLGDIQKGFADADQTININARKAQISGASVEPVSCVVKWDGNGKLEIWLHGQVPGTIRNRLATFFNIPRSNVLSTALYQGHMGGHFQWTSSVYNTVPA